MSDVSDMPNLPEVHLNNIVQKIGKQITDKVKNGTYASIPNEVELHK
jgi:hypothetical protein